MDKEDEKVKPDLKKEDLKESASFSSNIKNAHASGDGSIKRSEEPIDSPSEDSTKQTTAENTY